MRPGAGASVRAGGGHPKANVSAWAVSSRSDGRPRGYFSVEVQFSKTLNGGAPPPAVTGTGIKKRWPSRDTSKNINVVPGSLNKGCGDPMTLNVGSVSTATAIRLRSGPT